MAIVYVDDVIISTLRKESGEDLIREIEKTFEIGDIGPLDWYLGISFEEGRDTLRMSQKDYVEKMLLKYEVDANYFEEIPISENANFVRDEDDEVYQNFDLKGKIGSLMYLAVCTRPDIS